MEARDPKDDSGYSSDESSDSSGSSSDFDSSDSSHADGGQDQGGDAGGDEPPEYHARGVDEDEELHPGWIRETLTTDFTDDFFHPRLFGLVQMQYCPVPAVVEYHSRKFSHPVHTTY